MKAHIHVNMDNAAFGDGQHHRELARILRELANKIEHETPCRVRLLDINGNAVGTFVLK